MNGLCFIVSIIAIISHTCLVGFALYLAWRFLDLKYFSSSEIELLKQENKYLKEENKKVNGTSAYFYGKDYDKL